MLRSLASPAALTDPKRCASVVGVAAFAVRREHAPDALGGPPGLPAPRGFRAAFAAAYAVAYLAGGERRMLRLIRRYGPIMTMPILSLGDVAIVSDSALAKEVFTAPTDVLLGGRGGGAGSGDLWVGVDVCPGGAGASSTSKTLDAAITWRCAGSLRSDYRELHSRGDAYMAG